MRSAYRSIGVRRNRDRLAQSRVTGPLSSVTKDATGNIYFPSTAGEWTTTLAVAGISSGIPTQLWLCQDSGTPLANVITPAITLATTGTAPTYQSPLTGFSRLGILCADNANTIVRSLSASLPDVSVTDVLVYGVIQTTSVAPASTRTLFGVGTTTQELQITLTPRFRGVSGANGANGTAALTSTVRPFVLSTFLDSFYTLDEIIAPTPGAITGKCFRFASFSANAAAATHTYYTQFEGTAAQLTQGQIKTLLQTLGWTVAW